MAYFYHQAGENSTPWGGCDSATHFFLKLPFPSATEAPLLVLEP